MGKGVYTNDLRVKFVKGQVTTGTPDEGFIACGDETFHTLKVTLKQLEKILFRIRDTKWTDGSVRSAVAPLDEEDEAWFETGFAGGDPPETLAAWHYDDDDDDGGDPLNSSVSYSERGYTFWVESFTLNPLPAEKDRFFGPEYLVVDPTDGAPETTNYRDVVDDEYVLYEHSLIVDGFAEAPSFNVYDGNELAGGDLNYSVLKTAFNHYIGERQAVWAYYNHTHYGFYKSQYNVSNAFDALGSEADMDLYFGNRVAVVDNSGTGYLFAPENDFYMAVGFFFSSGVGTSFLSTLSFFADGSNVCDLVLKLGGADEVTAKIYASSESDVISAEDFVFEPTTWWPYAKDSPAVPVWNTLTGEKL